MTRFLAMICAFLPAIVGLTNCITTCADEPSFQIITKRHDDKVDVRAEVGKAHFSVKSPSGISQAIIERRSSKWPTAVMLRLHLKGLEKLKITNGKVTLEGAVSSQNGRVRLWKDGKEDSQLDTKDPNWMEIRMVGKNGKPVETIPLNDGYFEMLLPTTLFEDNPKSITVNWIDFYR